MHLSTPLDITGCYSWVPIRSHVFGHDLTLGLERLVGLLVTNKMCVLCGSSEMTETDVVDGYQISWRIYINMLLLYLGCAFALEIKLQYPFTISSFWSYSLTKRNELKGCCWTETALQVHRVTEWLSHILLCVMCKPCYMEIPFWKYCFIGRLLQFQLRIIWKPRFESTAL